MSRVLALVAHPDDAEIGLGGTLALLARTGHQVRVLVASVPDHRDTRLAELAAGSAMLGVVAEVIDHPGCWQVEDLAGYRLVAEFDKAMAVFEPDIVFTHSGQDPHTDHVLVHRAALASCRDRSCDIYLAEPPNRYAPAATPFPANCFVDVSSTFELKLAAVACYASQTGRRPYRRHLSIRARAHGEPLGVEYAEAFQGVRQLLFRPGG